MFDDYNNEDKEIIDTKPIKIDAFVEKEFSFLDYHADILKKIQSDEFVTEFSLIRGINIENHLDKEIQNVTLSFHFSDDAFSMEDISIPLIDANVTVGVRKIQFLKVSKKRITDLSSVDVCYLDIKLIDDFSHKILAISSHSFLVLPLDQPTMKIYEDYRLFAKYINPNFPCIKQLTLTAKEKYNHNEPIVAYQNELDKNAMLEEIQSIYLAIHDLNISYQNPPASTQKAQRIRFQDEVVLSKKGTCIDLSLLFAAALEEVGYHPFLVILDDHALVGVFLEEKEHFDNGIEKRLGVVTNMEGSGINKAIFIEATSLSSERKCSFSQAVSTGKSRLHMYDGSRFVAIDVCTCHHSYFAPLPLEFEEEELHNLISPKLIEERDIDPLTDEKYKDVLREEVKDRFTYWQNKLLDLTERNPLVSSSLRSTNTVRIIGEDDITSLFKSRESFSLQIFDFNEEEIDASYLLKESLSFSSLRISPKNGEAIAFLGHEKTLKNLISKSKSAMEETGAPTLYLCLGMLTFINKKKKRAHAPFMVLPIRIEKARMSSIYALKYDYDDIMINRTFFEYYKLEHPDVDFSMLYNISSEDSYMDAVSTFKKNCTEDIQLDENFFFVTNLTFSHYVMWLDMKTRKEELKKNKIVESILANQNQLDQEEESINVEKEEKYDTFAAPLPYDSTQFKAIIDCGKGKSFILDGPPGTGKSQTIVNMIINAFYHGKTVLFVAEKKAALDVVADRLKKCGLDKFCLELHSNKSNKVDFFEKLRVTMDTYPSKTPEEYQSICDQLAKEKEELLITINRMHEKNKYYMSLYDAIIQFKENEAYGNHSIMLSKNFILNYNEEQNKVIIDLLEKYKHIAQDIRSFDASPLKIIGSTDISYGNKDIICADFNALSSHLEELLDKGSSLIDALQELGMSFELNQETLLKLDSVLELVFYHDIFVTYINDYALESELDSYIPYLNQAVLMLQIEKEQSYRVDMKKLIDVDADSALATLNQTHGLKKLFIELKYKKLLRSRMKEGYKLKRKEVSSILSQAQNYNYLRKEVLSKQDKISSFVGDKILDHLEDIETIKEKYIVTCKFVREIMSFQTSYKANELLIYFTSLIVDKSRVLTLKLAYDAFHKYYLSYLEEEKEMQKKYVIRTDLLKQEYAPLDVYRDLLVYLQNEDHFSELLHMSQLNQFKIGLENLGVYKLIDSLLEGKILCKNLVDVYQVSLAKQFISLYFEDENIEQFNASLFEKKIKEYTEAIQKYDNLVIGEVTARITKNMAVRPDFEYAKTSPIGQLKKAIANHGRGLSIRQTLLRFDDRMKKMFPCFLMSPLSAAQYLAVDEEHHQAVSKFDIVIFDEASQIPTHEAIGPIARGNALIVAGDPEQMPPSNYFAAGIEVPAEEASEMEDSPSLLDECLSISLPRHRLCYHYRSKYESLIAFSNQNFYNNSLYTFPSPYLSVSSIEYRYVELSKTKKTSTITQEEIDIIYQTMKDVYKDPENQNKSMGIIVFNINQKEAVENFILEKLAKDDELSKILSSIEEKTKEPLFIKSLENVQGDERDIIILSIGFGKNLAGYPLINGPLVKENGQRRLNVAVSRSKEKMIILSTLHYYDFESDERIRAKGKGRITLKHFLEYAEKASMVPSLSHEADTSSITYYLKKDLEEDGMEVESNVGNSSFKVDLAIKGKNSSSYALGIIIDAKPLEGNTTCRDKMYVEPFMLSRLKWKIIHVYALEYFLDKKKVIRKIQSAIDYPVDDFVEPKIEPHIEMVDASELTPAYQCTMYKEVPGYSIYVKYDGEKFSFSLRSIIQKIVDVESPIAYRTLKERIKQAANMTKMSAKAETLLKRELSYSFSSFRTKDQDQDVYWSRYNTEMNTFRVGGNRDLYDIPREEILCAMKQVIQVQGNLEDEDLYRETLIALQYGSGVLNQKNRERLLYVHRWAIKTNKL